MQIADVHMRVDQRRNHDFSTEIDARRSFRSREGSRGTDMLEAPLTNQDERVVHRRCVGSGDEADSLEHDDRLSLLRRRTARECHADGCSVKRCAPGDTDANVH